MLCKNVRFGFSKSNNSRQSLGIYRQKREFFDVSTQMIGSMGLVSIGLLTLIGIVSNRYKVSNPDQYLVRTGLFIKDVNVSKQGFQWPFQTCRFINMQPTNFSFNLNSMSQEKLEFVLPCVFTIGPKNDIQSIEKYARLLPESMVTKNEHTDLHKLVQGIIEGETRVLSASLTIEEIFNDRRAYKEVLLKNIQEELSRFGLEAYNVNIKELQDTPGSEYFERMRQKKRSHAENEAKVDIAEAQKNGDIGAKNRQALTRQQVAQYESETVLKENERNQEMEKSNAELAVVQAQAFQKTEVAKIEAEKFAKIREAELQREVEQRRIAMETEKLRAVQFSKSQVLAETNIKDAEGWATSLKLKADAELYAEQKKAEGVLYSEQKKSEGILTSLNAQSLGIQNLINSFNGDTAALSQYLMINTGLYEKLAQANAIAIKDLKPKIVQWNTNGENGGNAITDILKMLPPILTTIHDQTGIKPGNWLVKMPKNDATLKE